MRSEFSLPSRTQLNELSRLIDAGIIRPIVEAVLPLDRAREAYERGITDHPRGKLVVAVVDDGGVSGGAQCLTDFVRGVET